MAISSQNITFDINLEDEDVIVSTRNVLREVITQDIITEAVDQAVEQAVRQTVRRFVWTVVKTGLIVTTLVGVGIYAGITLL